MASKFSGRHPRTKAARERARKRRAAIEKREQTRARNLGFASPQQQRRAQRDPMYQRYLRRSRSRMGRASVRDLSNEERAVVTRFYKYRKKVGRGADADRDASPYQRQALADWLEMTGRIDDEQAENLREFGVTNP